MFEKSNKITFGSKKKETVSVTTLVMVAGDLNQKRLQFHLTWQWSKSSQ